jgi:iron complex outermembrane receptor protein
MQSITRVGVQALTAVLLGGVAASPVVAQTVPAALGRVDSGGSSTSEPLKEVVVTGTLIARKDYVSQSPIVTVQAETLQQSGPAGTIDAALSQLPQFTPTAGSGAAFPNRLGQALLNLRGLGSNRMLILLDGRRIQPSAPDGSVDVNLLPSALIDSVETITGGASAVYGSDAITGVVNFKLLDHFNGFKASAQYNQPELGTGGSYNANFALGSPFAAGRGEAMLSLDYTKRGEVKAGQRPFYAISRTNGIIPLAVVNFGAAPPTQGAVDSVFGRYGFAPGSASATRQMGVNYDATLFTAAPATLPVINYKGPLNDQFLNVKNAIINSAGTFYDIMFPLERENAFGRVSFDLTDATQVFATALYNHSVADVNNATVGLGQIASYNGVVPVTNPFIPDDLRTLLASRRTPNASFNASYLLDSLPGVQFATTSDEVQGTLGANGGLFGTAWKWNLYGTYGRTQTSQSINGFSYSAAQQLLMAPDGGASLCAGGFNIFGPPTAISASCLDFLADTGTTKALFEQQVVDGNVQGKVLELPAGELRAVIGADYRNNHFTSEPTANFVAGDVVPQGVLLPARGSQAVKEIYVETLVPLIKDVALVKALNLDLGYRFSDYSTSGGVSTYKADLDWTLVPSFTLRGGYSHAIRAPSLADVYTPASLISVTLGTPSATSTNGDPCDVRSSYRQGANAAEVRALCLAQGVPQSIIDSFTFTNNNVFPTSLGNTDLDPEEASTYTIGGVWRSTFESALANDLQLSVDYYDIRVTDAIGIVPFLTTLSNCFNGDKASNPAYSSENIFCGAITRNSLGQISQDSRSQTLNLASYRTNGVDLQADWRFGLGVLGLDDRYGSLSVNFLGTWLDKFVIQTFKTAPALDFAGSTQGSITNSVLPKWKSATTLTYRLESASLGLRWRYLSSVHDVSRVTTVGSTTPGVPAISYFDLNGRWAPRFFSQDIELRAGVSNLFDKGIPQVGPVTGTTDPTTYDIIGRSYYLGVSARF